MRPRSWADAAAAAAALLVVSSLVACGIPADSQPRALASKDIPFDLLAPSTTVATPGTPGARASISVYLVGITGLVPVSREVREPATLPEALNSLLAGPTAAEAAQGISSEVAPSARWAARSRSSPWPSSSSPPRPCLASSRCSSRWPGGRSRSLQVTGR